MFVHFYVSSLLAYAFMSYNVSLQCSGTVGWATVRASSLYKSHNSNLQRFSVWGLWGTQPNWSKLLRNRPFNQKTTVVVVVSCLCCFWCNSELINDWTARVVIFIDEIVVARQRTCTWALTRRWCRCESTTVSATLSALPVPEIRTAAGT